ncbi:VENN motif pre-toxin domain-containing protein [Pseudomonas sp. E102]|uniref:VENN motif pre-toxin domain-containing protein n=1 Tax=Pseudomonas sp. E102 TaxID=181579 RepID=UPI0040454AB4
MVGNITGALSGAAAPYIAQEIRDATEGDSTANLMAHAVLGALVARASGNSALAGAVGAVAAEEAARIIKEQLYGGVSNDQLTQEQKQTISSLATLVAGIGGASVGAGSLDAVAAALAGKNAVENNYLSLQEATRKAVLERKTVLSDDEKAELASIKKRDKDRDAAIASICTAGNKSSGGCAVLVAQAQEALAKYGENASYRLLYKDLYPADAENLEKALQGLGAEDVTRDVVITALSNESGMTRDEVERRYDLAMTLSTLTATLAGFYGIRGVTGKTDTAVPGPANFMGDTDLFFKNASKRSDVDADGFFDVIAHGSKQKIEIVTPNGTVMADQRVVSRLIENNPNYTGQPIRLLSCDTGACDTGFAQNLANKMGVPVKAPTSLVWAYGNGKVVVAPRSSSNPSSPLFNLPDLANQGTFKTFNPGRP